MAYIPNERDMEFNLFEWLKVGSLTQFEKFKDHNEDLYKMVVSEAQKFALKELDPLYVLGDRQECHIKDGVVVTPKGFKEAYKKLAENGFIGIDTPTTYGGQGLPVTLLIALYDHFTGANVAFSMYSGLSRGVAHLIETSGKKELADLLCAKMYDGTWTGTMCLTEPQAGSAVGDLKTVAKPLPDGTYQIRGNKIFISGGDHDLTDNIIHMVLARVEGDPAGTKGISLFIVPKTWINPDGSLGKANDVNCVNVEHKMGIKASSTCSLNFGENNQCRGFLLGERGNGMKYMFQMMNEARMLCGLQGEALASTAYENALKYAKERIQGGGNVIINYPNVRRNLSLCKSLVEGMRGLLYRTAYFIDVAAQATDPVMKEHAQNRADLMTPVCKSYCSDFGFRVTELAVQIYGGYGYILEYPVEQYLRDVKIASIYEGTNGIQALDLMGRKLNLKSGQLFREYHADLMAFADAEADNAELKDSIDAFKKAVDTVAQVAMKITEWGMSGETVSPLLSANPFLEMVGHTTLANILLEQAVVAQAKIKAGKNEAFYRNKIRSAKFFVTQVLPHVQMRAKNILSGDKNAIEMEF